MDDMDLVVRHEKGSNSANTKPSKFSAPKNEATEKIHFTSSHRVNSSLEPIDYNKCYTAHDLFEIYSLYNSTNKTEFARLCPALVYMTLYSCESPDVGGVEPAEQPRHPKRTEKPVRPQRPEKPVNSEKTEIVESSSDPSVRPTTAESKSQNI
jgi:hypothetical protein